MHKKIATTSEKQNYSVTKALNAKNILKHHSAITKIHVKTINATKQSLLES